MSLPKSYASSIHGEMPDDALADYKAVFPPEVAKFPYDKQRVNRVTKIRATLGGSLFFDRLCLEHLDRVENIQEEYPPKATSYLKHLFERILQSSIDRLRQHSFVYYLLRDYDEDRARKYAERALIPEHFVRLMDGIWFLDHLEFEKALPYITHPGVHFPYPDMLLSSLHTAQAPTYLTLTYIECANPSLLSDDSIFLYFRSLLSISPAQSFLYTRVAPAHLRKQLLRNLVEYYLSSEEEDRHKNALILLDLPLTKEEELVVEDVLKRMTGKAASLARDTLWVRWESKGKLGEVLDVASRQAVESEEKAAGVNWGDLSRGVELGLGGRRGLAEVTRN